MFGTSGIIDLSTNPVDKPFTEPTLLETIQHVLSAAGAIGKVKRDEA